MVTEPTADRGIRFAEIDGRQSSLALGKRVVSSAARFVDADLAERIDHTKDWRKGYMEPIRGLTELGARSTKDALRIAADGIEALHKNVLFVRDGVVAPLHATFEVPVEVPLSTGVIEGRNTGRVRQLAIPYKGEQLTGDALSKRLDAWVAAGTIEPSCAEAIRAVMASPEWLDLSDRHFALLGAAAEMGPLEWLCRWGANVYAVDVPARAPSDRIVTLALAGCGRVHVPVHGEGPTGPGEIADSAGADLLTDAPEISAWLRSFDVPMTIGNYVYADGSDFVRLAAVADALVAGMIERDRRTSMSYLATPTDVFAVPWEVVDAARSRQTGTMKSATRLLSAGRLFAPSYTTTVRNENGAEWGIFDCLVAQQGPNYALAKNVQKWRALGAREAGVVTSANVAPATHTRSVLKNKILASAYAGAGPFGVEIFAPETSRALMAALLVHDIRNPGAAAAPTTELTHPYELFAQGAAHGGLWRLPHQPRTVLPLAVGVGLVKR
ncbi:MAG: hypothetical protein ACRDI3_09060 [Actinomycetota bacterium]